MKRDLDVIRTLLQFIEDGDYCDYRVVEFTLDEFVKYAGEGVTEHEVFYNLKQMDMSNLVDFASRPNFGSMKYGAGGDGLFNIGDEKFAVFGLTPLGHDYLDAVRSEGIWATTKDAVAETGGSATLEMVKSLATAFAKKKIEQHTGLAL